jgi:hypothetical protein
VTLLQLQLAANYDHSAQQSAARFVLVFFWCMWSKAYYKRARLQLELVSVFIINVVTFVLTLTPTQRVRAHKKSGAPHMRIKKKSPPRREGAAS